MKTSLHLLVTIIALTLAACKEPDKKMVFPEGLQAYSVVDSLSFDRSWLKAEKKLVVASFGLYIFSIPFMDLVEEYDLPVIIVIFVKDKDKIIDKLKEYNFPYPFIHDPDRLFLQNNNLRNKLGISDEESTLLPFFMQEDEVYEPAQIGMRHVFKEQLKSFMSR